MSVRKNTGGTRTERWLAQLCERTFLKMWSYPSPYKNQGGAKEICDVLVVFDHHVFILSDKFCEVPDTGELRSDWNRWYRRAIKKSADQTHGAERWLREHPERVFVDESCAQRLPVRLPDPSDAVVHRVVIAHGSYDRCAKFWNDTGDLVINSALAGDEHLWPHAFDGTLPPAFQVGNVTPEKDWVHVFDTKGVELVLRCLDTVADLSNYLSERARLLTSLPVFCPSEADLVGLYFQGFDAGRQVHFFDVDSTASSLAIEQGIGADFFSSREFAGRQAKNENSYAWDSLIDTFAHHILEGDQHHRSHDEPHELEPLIRFLAQPGRVQRRVLATALLEAVQQTPRGKRRIRYCLPSKPSEPYFAFLVLPPIPGASHEEYRVVRRGLLEATCRVIRLRHDDALDVIGIATEHGESGSLRSEDAVHYDGRNWTASEETTAREQQKRLGILLKPSQVRMSTTEFPEEDAAVVQAKSGRNSPCPCGSGRKFKRCCLPRGRT